MYTDKAKAIQSNLNLLLAQQVQLLNRDLYSLEKCTELLPKVQQAIKTKEAELQKIAENIEVVDAEQL